MPIYEYECKSCGHQLEKLQKMSDPELTDCPACSAPELHKLISAAGFRLKGGGWYETDFKKNNKRNLADSTDKKPAEKKTTAEAKKASPAGKTAAS